MKKGIAIIILSMFILTTGCATTGPNADYQAYTATLQAQFVASQEPLVAIEVDVDGKISGIVINQPMRPIHVEQKRDHPIYLVASNLIRVCGIVGGIWAVGESMSNIIEAGAGNTNINSMNNNSGNEGSIASDYSIVDTVSTETITTTGVE